MEIHEFKSIYGYLYFSFPTSNSVVETKIIIMIIIRWTIINPWP